MFSEGFEFSEPAGTDWRVDVDWTVDEDILAMAKKQQVENNSDIKIIIINACLLALVSTRDLCSLHLMPRLLELKRCVD